MREALARADHDFILTEDRPRPAARSKSRKAPRREVWDRLAFLARRPARTILGATFAALVTGITLNALLFQHGHHPAPLFGAARKVELPARAPAVPAPQRQADATPAAPAPATPAVIPTPPPRPASPRTAIATEGDAIGALIKGTGTATSSDPKGTVAAAQKALMRLGFVLKPDGIFGNTTRLAIEKFERDNNLTISGELSPKVIRALASRSGVAIP